LMLFQNSHRYFFYAASIIVLINTWDMLVPFFHGSDGGFGVGLGNLIMLANVLLLWGYSFGCLSCRHLLGGRLRSFGKHPVQYWFWSRLTYLNGRHMLFGWLSLASLMITDAYIALLASGTITDLRFFNWAPGKVPVGKAHPYAPDNRGRHHPVHLRRRGDRSGRGRAPR